MDNQVNLYPNSVKLSELDAMGRIVRRATRAIAAQIHSLPVGRLMMERHGEDRVDAALAKERLVADLNAISRYIFKKDYTGDDYRCVAIGANLSLAGDLLVEGGHMALTLLVFEVERYFEEAGIDVIVVNS